MKLVNVCTAATACLLVAMTGCGGEDDSSLQDRIVAESLLDQLTDTVYQFPANSDSNSATVYLQVRKWDFLFFGDIKPDINAPNRSMYNVLIPGKYNHLMVYVGKDAEGYAYAVELNIDDIGFTNDLAQADGGMLLLCLGIDYGNNLHPSGERAIDRDYYGIRWAKTFLPAVHSQIMVRDAEMTGQVMADFRADYPYQLEFLLSVSKLISGDREIVLIDDGFAGGAGCADYWTTLLETYAGVCMKDSRMNGNEISNYFLNTEEGRSAFLPANYNPLGSGDLRISDLFGMGFTIRDSAPHRYDCDGTEEVGIVITQMLMESPLLSEP